MRCSLGNGGGAKIAISTYRDARRCLRFGDACTFDVGSDGLGGTVASVELKTAKGSRAVRVPAGGPSRLMFFRTEMRVAWNVRYEQGYGVDAVVDIATS